MLKIRLQRTGRTNDPSYRVVVTEHTNGPKSGRAVEKVGTYNPKSKVRVLDGERIKYWLSKGAQASGTMHNMLISAGIITGKKINVLPKKTVPKPADAEAVAGKKEEEATPAAAAPVAEAAPTDEPKAEEAPAEEKKDEVTAETSAQV
ncbi:MAG: 30S ribosomal protein S16 [Patescibacteria group bacterium]